jgi:hypothetical protein
MIPHPTVFNLLSCDEPKIFSVQAAMATNARGKSPLHFTLRGHCPSESFHSQYIMQVIRGPKPRRVTDGHRDATYSFI